MVPRYDYLEAARKQEEDDTPRVEAEDDGMSTYSSDDDHDYHTIMPDPSYTGGWPHTPPWNTLHTYTRGPQATDGSSLSSTQQAALPENTAATSGAPTVVGSNQPSGPATTGANEYGDGPFGSHKKQSSNNAPMYAAAGIVPVVLIIVGAVVFLCLRKRKRQRAAATRGQLQEMKMRNQPTVQAYMAPPPLPREPSYTAPPSHPPPASPTSPAPVILGPITSGSSGNYMTGIDTSDAVSVRNERTGLGDPFADGNSLHEEPPPPYRPSSIPPLSRDTSLRVPPTALAASSQTSLIGTQNQPLRSPFDDPEDDDVVSDISGHSARRNRDDMSAVSDLSYQQDPVVTRPAV